MLFVSFSLTSLLIQQARRDIKIAAAWFYYVTNKTTGFVFHQMNVLRSHFLQPPVWQGQQLGLGYFYMIQSTPALRNAMCRWNNGSCEVRPSFAQWFTRTEARLTLRVTYVWSGAPLMLFPLTLFRLKFRNSPLSRSQNNPGKRML